MTALLDVSEAARLDIEAWLAALRPDVVELRTPAWSEVGMEAIGWPSGHTVLVRVLTRLGAAGASVRVALHPSSLTVGGFHTQQLNDLALELGLDSLDLVLRPVLGEHAPPLQDLARMAAALTQTAHRAVASKLVPACGLPVGMDSEATFATERSLARQAYTVECRGCPARDGDRCDGMPADLLSATVKAGATWQGWPTLAAEREAIVVVAEPNDRLEQIALRLGLRRVWRSELPLVEAAALTAHPPAGLHVVLGPTTTIDPEAQLEFGRDDATWQIQYLAANEDDAQAARAAEAITIGGTPAEMEVGHRNLARLFGYPDYGIEAFVSAARLRRRTTWNGVAENAFASLQAARASQVLDRRLDFGTPIDDGCIVRHTPCRYDCAESLRLVQTLETELARIAPGRHAAKRALLVDAVLVFADSAQIPLLGERGENGSLRSPTPVTKWHSTGPRAVVAQRALDALAAQLVECVELVPTHTLRGAGGVTAVLANGSRKPLLATGVPTHPQFPRLLVFEPAREAVAIAQEIDRRPEL